MSKPIESKQEATLRDFLNVAFRRRWLIVSMVLLASVLVVFFNERRPELYASGSRILVQRGEQTSLLHSPRYLTWEEDVSSQIQVILSEPVFERAKEIFRDSMIAAGRDPEVYKFNPASVRADVMGESNAFVIRYVDLDPTVVRPGCQAQTLSFQEYYRAHKAPPALSDFFAAEIADVREDLDHWRKRRSDFLNNSRYFGMEETSKFIMQKMSVLENELVKLDSDLSGQETRVKQLAELAHKSGSELEKEVTFTGQGQLLQLQLVSKVKFELQNLRMKREELTQKYTDEHPEVMAVENQIRELHADLKQQIESAYRVESNRLDELRARRNSVRQDYEIVKAELDKVPDKESQLSAITDMIKKLEAQHQLLLSKQSEAEIALASRNEWQVTVLSHAGPPVGGKRNDYVRLALGPLLALIVALGLAFFLESVDHSIKNTAEVEEYLHTPVLATISELPARKKSA